MAEPKLRLLPLLLARCSLRHWSQAPGSTLMLLGILSLGVGVFVSIRLANLAAVASFTRFTDTITGQSDAVIEAPAGTLPDTVLRELRTALGTAPVQIVPIVQVTAARPPTPGETDRFGRTSYTLLGVDLLAVSNLAPQLAARSSYFSPTPAHSSAEPQNEPDSPPDTKPARQYFWTTLLAGPRLWLSPRFPAPLPDQVALVLDERVVNLPVAGLIPTAAGAPAVPANLMIMDLGQLQALIERPGRLDRVEFVLESGPQLAARRAELRTKLESLSAAGTRWIVGSGANRETAATMTRAFRLNLTVLSLIALLVGLYLIFQALDGAVVRRRDEISILRSLGVTEQTVLQLWLIESAVLGLLGGALGSVLGWLGAQGAVRAVGRTINALYYETTVQAAGFAPAELALGLTLGLVTGLIAGWLPARAAARTLPAHVLQRGAAPAAGSLGRHRFPLALGLIGGGVVFTQLPPWHFAGGGRFPIAGYLAAFGWIFGGGLLSAMILPRVARGLRRWGGHDPAGRIALSHLRNPSGRHRLAVAALHGAVGMTAGMAILVGSFDFTMSNWVQTSLRADLYVSSSGAQTATPRNRINAAAAAAMASHPAVEAASRLVAYPIMLDGQPTLLSGADLGMMAARSPLPWVDAPRDAAVFDPARNAGLGLVSESFTARFRCGRGDQISIPTPSGPRAITIAGVFADYGNERGSILLERVHVREWFADDQITNLALWLRDGVDATTVRADLLATYPGLSVYSNAVLRAEVLRIFRQTFAITYALEVIGVLVAIIGLGLTLISILLDRRNELTTLRALGFSRREIARATAIEGAAVATAAVLGGTALSLALGWLLIYVINKQSFGWTLGFAIPAGQLAALGAVVISTGALVSWFVGRWGAKLPADREE